MKKRFLLVLVLTVWIVVFATFGCVPQDIGSTEGAKVVRVREHSRPARDRELVTAWHVGFINES